MADTPFCSFDEYMHEHFDLPEENLEVDLLIFKADQSIARNKYDKAIHELKKALKLVDNASRQHFEVSDMLGDIQKQRGEWKEAFENYKTGIRTKIHIFGESSKQVTDSFAAIAKTCMKSEQLCLKYLDLNSEFQNTSEYFNLKGQLLVAQGLSEDAINCFRNSLNICTRIYGQYHRNKIKIIDLVGDTFVKNGDFSRGIVNYKMTYSLRSQLFLNDDVRCMKSYIKIGIAYFRSGDPVNALSILNYCEEREIPDIGIYTHLMDTIGLILMSQSKYCQSIKYLEKTYDLRSETYGKSHSCILKSMVNIGIAYFQMKDYSMALNYYKKCSRKCREFHEICHPLAIDILYYKILAKIKTGQIDNLIALIQKVENRISKLSEHDNDRDRKTEIMIKLAYLYGKIGNYEKSIEILNENKGNSPLVKDFNLEIKARTMKKIDKNSAIELFKELLTNRTNTNNYLGIADSSFQLGNLHYDIEEYMEARNYYKHFFTYFEITDQAKNNKYAKATEVVGLIYEKHEKFLSSLKYFKLSLSALDIAGSMLSKSKILDNIGYVNFKLNRFDDSIDSYEKSIEYYKAVTGHEISIAYVYNQLGGIYKKMGMNEKAIESYEISLNLFEQHLGQADHTTMVVLQNLIKSYYDTRNYEQIYHYYHRFQAESS